MSDTVMLAIIAGLTTAVPIIITQVTGIFISIRGREKVLLKTEQADKKLDSIHEQTNSNLTETKAQIKALTEQVQDLIQERGRAQGKAEATEAKS